MKTTPSRTGFTLVEMLISIALLTMIVVSVAAAVRGAMDGFVSNTRVAEATHASRGLLDCILTDVRQAAAIDPNLTDGNSVCIIMPTGSTYSKHRYRYHDANEAVYLDRYTGISYDSSVELLGGEDGIRVTSFTISRTTGLDWQGYSCTKSVAARFTINVDGQQQFICGSACPRRNQDY